MNFLLFLLEKLRGGHFCTCTYGYNVSVRHLLCSTSRTAHTPNPIKPYGNPNTSLYSTVLACQAPSRQAVRVFRAPSVRYSTYYCRCLRRALVVRSSCVPCSYVVRPAKMIKVRQGSSDNNGQE